MQQQQQQQPMMNMMPSFPPTNITTEQIQKYLDENKKLIMAILDNQNLGKLAECAQYQAQLQKNLMYLAAIADAQPPAPQVPPHPAMQQGGHYMQHPQAAAMGQQPSGFPSKMPMPFNPQQMQDQQQQQLQHQHQQAVQGHLGMRPGVSNGVQGMHNEINMAGGNGGGPSPTSGVADFSGTGASGAPGAGVGTGGGGGGVSSTAGGGVSSNSMDGRGGKQDGAEAASGDARENTAPGNSNANGEPSFMKGSEDA